MQFLWNCGPAILGVEISGDDQISEIWPDSPELTSIDQDLLEMDLRRADLGVCGSLGIGYLTLI